MTREEFRSKLKTRLVFIRVFIVAFVLINIASRLLSGYIELHGEYANFLAGFVMGASASLIVPIAVIYQRYSKALSDKNRFEEEYLKQIDERTIFIRQKCGAEVIIPLTLIIIAAALIAGYFSITVCLTLISVSLFQALVCVALKVYYMKKY